MSSMKVNLYNSSGTKSVYEKIKHFSFFTDVLIPYTFLKASLSSPNIAGSDYSRAELEIDGKVIHCGFIDTISSSDKNGIFEISFVSKGFTALMTQNYIVPGMYTNISFNDLMDTYVDFPFITHEQNDEKVNYIYVKDDRSFWDSAANLAYKLKGTYPYITECCKVNITIPTVKSEINVENRMINEFGIKSDYRRLVSDIYMQDADGEYEKYHLHNSSCDGINIMRKRQIPLDRQYLYDPPKALEYRRDYVMNKIKHRYIEVRGYPGAELYNTLTASGYGITQEDIKRIEIRGSEDGTATRIYVD